MEAVPTRTGLYTVRVLVRLGVQYSARPTIWRITGGKVRTLYQISLTSWKNPFREPLQGPVQRQNETFKSVVHTL